MSAKSFCITFSSLFSTDELKTIFVEFGKVAEVNREEAMQGNTRGYKYIIHMESWTKSGEYFRNELLETGTYRCRYDHDDYGRPMYFICEPIP